MTSKYLYTLLLLIFGGLSLKAQVIEGKLSDQENNVLPFANIFIKGSSIGTTSNEEGRYRLELPAAGSYEIVYQYIGYQQQIIAIKVGEGETLTQDVTLASESLNLSEIVITGEDPAYEMIRQAQAKRKYYLEEEVQSFRCNTYSKVLMRSKGYSSIDLSIFGVNKQVEAGDSGIFYLSEAITEYSFAQPNKLREDVKASLVSGKANDYTLNRSSTANLYQNLPFMVNDLRIVSPIARNAFEHYDYEFLGDFKENGSTINKIKLIPKDTYSPAFTGVIYLIENSWRLHSFEVYLSRPLISGFKKITLRQNYVPIGEAWMPSVMQFFFDLVGETGGGYYLTVASDYEVNVDFPDGHFSQDAVNVKPNSNQKNAFFWDLARPLPLTEEEKNDYQARFQNYEAPKQDSTRREETLKDVAEVSGRTHWAEWLFLGAKYENTAKGTSWETPSLLSAFLNYNTVEGLVFNYAFTYQKTWENHRKLRLNPTLRYGFKNETPQAKLAITYDSKPSKFAQWQLEGGRFVQAFSRNGAISEIINTFYSLTEGENFLKLYQKTFAQIKHRRELLNGLQIGLGVEYAYREAMRNHTEYSWVKTENMRFTPNFPPENYEVTETNLTEANEAFFINAALRYAPGERYRTSPKEKTVLANALPVLELRYRRGLLDTDFEKLDFLLRDQLPMGLFGTSRLQIGAGIFLNNNRMTFIDYHHFLGNRTGLSYAALEHFDLLDYYQFSTQKGYIEAHYQHNFDGFFFRGIPLLKKWKWQNVLVSNYLYTEAGGHYLEAGWGIEGILSILKLEYVWAFQNGHYYDSGLRIGVTGNLPSRD